MNIPYSKSVIMSALILMISFGYFFDQILSDLGISLEINPFWPGSLGFKNFLELFNFAKMKLLIIIFGSLWYLTCKQWWKSAILIIITLELLKFTTMILNQTYYLDEIEYIKSLPITIPLISGLFFVSWRLNHLNYAKDLRNALDEEIDNVFFEIEHEKLKQLEKFNENFKSLKNKNLHLTTAEYLKKLLKFRDEYYDN